MTATPESRALIVVALTWLGACLSDPADPALGVTAQRDSVTPSVDRVVPATAYIGDTVEIDGANLTSPTGTTIQFGPYATAPPYCDSSTRCFATVPVGVGLQDVRVTVGSLTSPITGHDEFEFHGPTIFRLSQSEGPTAGGTQIDIIGRGFDPDPPRDALVVNFKNTWGEAWVTARCQDTTWCTVTSPPFVTFGPAFVDLFVLDAAASSITPPFTYDDYALPSRLTYDGAGGLELEMNGLVSPTQRVILTSSDPTVVQLPAHIDLNGTTRATVPVTVLPSAVTEDVTLSASAFGTTVTTVIHVFAGPPLAISTDANVVATGATTVARVASTTPAPAGGVTIALSSSDPGAIAVPASLVLAEGSRTASVTLTNVYAGPPEQVTLTARYGAQTASWSVWVPSDGSCVRRSCPTGQFWSTADCLCETGTPR